MKQSLRLVNERDLPTIREWRNHPKINQYMFSQHLISEEEHKNWFDSSLNNALRKMFIYEVDDSKLGFVQFQQRTTGLGVLEWGFYIGPHAERGTGSRMAELALEKAFQELGALKVYGEVLPFNLPSIRLHERFHFKLEGILRQHHLLNEEYHDIHCYGQLKSEWIKSKRQVKS
ncbi:MAG: UDP-4-amino-4,6-dideoxy-N-acetyl-beta-L-altrosamine N-acetyltransferase [Methylophaga sp.]